MTCEKYQQTMDDEIHCAFGKVGNFESICNREQSSWNPQNRGG